jgi:hypothetical protein
MARLGGSYLFSLEAEEPASIFIGKEELNSLRQRLFEWISDTEMGQLSSTPRGRETQQSTGGVRLLLHTIEILYFALRRVLPGRQGDDALRTLRHRLG